jgi:hypothetical protein
MSGVLEAVLGISMIAMHLLAFLGIAGSLLASRSFFLLSELLLASLGLSAISTIHVRSSSPLRACLGC